MSKINPKNLYIEAINSKTNPLRSDWNLDNYYYYPLGMIECSGGNHSQLSALLESDSNEVSDISNIIDLSALYDAVIFNGYQFREIENDRYLMSCNSQTEVLFGVFFEIGRLLKDHKDYFPKFVIDAVNK